MRVITHSSLIKRCSHFIHMRVWPWKRIKELVAERDEAVAAARLCHETYINGYNAHWNNWVSIANQYYGPNAFTDVERALMRRFYDEGYGWSEANNRLRIMHRYNRSGHGNIH